MGKIRHTANTQEDVRPRATAAWFGTTLDLPERQVQRILREAYIAPEKEKGGYLVGDSLRAIVQYYKTAADKVTHAAAESRARREEADAITAEVNAQQALGKTALKNHVSLIWADWFARFREHISNAPYLKAIQREKIAAAMQRIKLSEDLPES